MNSQSAVAPPIVALMDAVTNPRGGDGNEAVRVAADLAWHRGSALHVVACYRDGTSSENRMAAFDAAERALEAFRDLKLEIWIHTSSLPPAEAVNRVAQSAGAERIITTAGVPGRHQRHGRTLFARRSSAGATYEVSVASVAPAPQPEPAPETSDRRFRNVLLISTLAVFMAFLDATIVNVAFPAIHRSFAGVSLGNLSWVLNSYNVVVAAALVPAGRLIDRFGRRRGFLAGLGVFLFGSVICAVSPDAGALIAARVLQALGAAMLIPASFSVVLAACPAEKRAMATSVWAATGAVAAAAGPSLGGVLVQAGGWRWIFLVNLVFALGMVRAPRILTESRESDRPVPDLIGSGLLALAVGFLALGIVKAPDWGWGGTATLACWGGAVLLAVALVWRSSGHPAPVIEPELLRIRSFALANVGFLIFSVGFYALLLGNILFLTDVWHYSVLRAGFAVTPGPLAAAVAAALGGRLSERFSPRAVAVPGMIGFAVACLLYRDVPATPAYLTHWLPAQIPSGVGIGLTLSALTTAAIRDLPPDRVATGSALTSCFRQIGAVLGIAGVIAIVSGITAVTGLHHFQLAWALMASASALSILPALGLGAQREDRRAWSAAAARRAAIARIAGRARPAPPLVGLADGPGAGVAAGAAPRLRTIPGLERRELVLRGSRVSFSIGGDGPPVVLLHGLLDDSLTWRRVAPKLARRYTVIVPDLPGHGRSEASSLGDYSPSSHALILRDLLDELSVDRVALVGHSLGGPVALMFAAQNPARTARMALISPGGFGREVHPALRYVATPAGTIAVRIITGAFARGCVRLGASVLGRVGRRRAAAGLLTVSELLAGLAPAPARNAFLRSTSAVIDRQGQIASAFPWMGVWKAFPTLVLWGSADRVIPAAHLFALAEANPLAEVVLLDGVGHLAHRERPMVVADRLKRFLDEGAQQRPVPELAGVSAETYGDRPEREGGRLRD